MEKDAPVITLNADDYIAVYEMTSCRASDHSESRRTPERAAIDVDRRIGWPGQGYSYQVGQLEIRRLRNQAERDLGPKFDIREFHDRVLENGTITLPMLRVVIERWIAATKTR